MGHNLSLPRSPLLGRGDSLARVQQLLLAEEVGLLTLTGPGGIGKTRLALQAAANLLDHFVDGVHFIALAAISDPTLVLGAVAQALGVHETPAQPLLASLQDHLRLQQVLLVVDNFEQVLSAAPAVAELLHACPQLKVLVTSRAPLHLYGEHEFAVPSLAVPEAGDVGKLASGALAADAVAGLRRYAAVDLFCRRAAAVQPGFSLTATNSLAVAQICIGLDGLPLAIELAAARLKLFGPATLAAQATLAARLQVRLALLTGGAQDLPPRQRTLRDEIAWSYNLLRPEEQLLFRRLGVFAGGFTLEAAQAVAGTERSPAGSTAGAFGLDVFDGLVTLVDQSLLRQQEQAGAEPRFGMLETIREYALEQLDLSGEADLVRSCHAHYFMAFAEAMEGELAEEAAKQRVCARLHADFENMRAAVAWCVRPRPHAPGTPDTGTLDRGELALRLAGALAWSGLVGERLQDVSSLLETALQLAGGSRPARAKALWGAGTMAMFLGSYEAARAHLAESCKLYRAAGDTRGLALALREACGAAFAQRDLAAAQKFGEESIALLRAGGDQNHLAVALDNLGATFAAQGKHVAAQAAFKEEYAICIAQGYRSSLALATMGLGWVAGLQGDYAAAAAQLDKAVALQRELEESWTLAQALHLLGQAAERSGELLHAGRCYRESLLLADQMGDKAAVAEVLRQLAGLAYAQGQYEDSVRLLAASGAHHPAGGAIFYTLDGPAERSQLVADARTKLGEDLFAACWAQGRTIAPQQALALAAEAGEAAPSISGPYRRSPMPLPGHPDHLTAREVEVLQLLVHGLTYADIADRLVISPRTVNAHLTAIYSKFDVNSRQEAVRFAIKHRLLPAPGRTPAGTG